MLFLDLKNKIAKIYRASPFSVVNAESCGHTYFGWLTSSILINSFASFVMFLKAVSSYSNSPQETFINVSLLSSPTKGEMPLSLEEGYYPISRHRSLFIPSEKSENSRFCDVFREYRKSSVAWNRLMKLISSHMNYISKISSCYYFSEV